MYFYPGLAKGLALCARSRRREGLPSSSSKPSVRSRTTSSTLARATVSQHNKLGILFLPGSNTSNRWNHEKKLKQGPRTRTVQTRLDSSICNVPMIRRLPKVLVIQLMLLFGVLATLGPGLAAGCLNATSHRCSILGQVTSSMMGAFSLVISCISPPNKTNKNNKQTNKPKHKQASQPANKQTSKQASKQTNKQHHINHIANVI